MRITHVQTAVERGHVHPAPADPPFALDLECAEKAFRYALWTALFFAQHLRRSDFEQRLTVLVRDLDRERA